jgi:hypothetical protein
MRFLLISYSQSGDAARVAEALRESLHAPGVEIVPECIRPVPDYPFPWKSLFRFFNVLPECHLGPPSTIEQPVFNPDDNYDLILLIYQVWFLTPSLPIQGFLASPAARVLSGRKVITVSVSRNMWQSASEAMKKRLRQLGALHLDNIVVTHQGPPWATFVTAPRFLLFGKKDPFWGIFPPAGLSEVELERVQRLGTAIRERSDRLQESQSLLRGLGAVELNRRYLLPELIGWYLFRGWAYFLKGLGKVGRVVRLAGIGLFMLCLVTAVVLGIPLLFLLSLLLYPVVRRMSQSYAERLAEPSGTASMKSA